MDLDTIIGKLQNNKFFLSEHAEKEKQADMITYNEMDKCFTDLELLEDYPNDSRGHSCLILGFSDKNNPIHFVIGNLDQEKLLIITMYRPDENKWINFKKRK